MKKLLLFALVLLFVGCPPMPKNAAKIYLQRGEYVKAKEMALNGIKESPDDYEYYCILGKAEIGLNNWLDASQALQNAFKKDSLLTTKWLSNDKDNISVYWQTFYNAAFNLSIKKKFEEALANLKYCKIIDQGNTNQYILEGNIYTETGDKESAVRAYNKVIAIDPENPEAYFFIGNVLFEKKLYDSTKIYYNNAINYFEKDYNRIKGALFQNVEFDKSLAQELIELWNEKKSDELDRLVKTKLGFDEGLTAHQRNLEKFVKITDGLARSHYFRGMTQYNLRNDSLALKDLIAALDLAPKDLNALFFAGEILIRFKKFDEARSYFEKLTELKPEDFAAWFYVGVCYSQAKNYKKAIEVWEDKTLPLEPKNIDVMTNLAYAYREIGDNKKALEYLVKVEKLQKENK